VSVGLRRHREGDGFDVDFLHGGDVGAIAAPGLAMAPGSIECGHQLQVSLLIPRVALENP
jgi:hypothetical protein